MCVYGNQSLGCEYKFPPISDWDTVVGSNSVAPINPIFFTLASNNGAASQTASVRNRYNRMMMWVTVDGSRRAL
jgi:DNA mismatch repair protein MutH